MCLIPENLMYTATHEWVEKLADGRVKVGITDYAQKELGDIVYVDLTDPGQELEAGEALAEIESVKAVSPVLSPVGGEVSEINEELYDAPEKINESPYGAWFVILSNITGEDDLLDCDEYARSIEEEND